MTYLMVLKKRKTEFETAIIFSDFSQLQIFLDFIFVIGFKRPRFEIEKFKG